MTDLTVANTILAQLGGRAFKVITGAKDFVGGADSLSFSIPKAKKGINKVRIVLNAADTYDVTFYKYARLDLNEIATVNNVYCDQLQDVFTTHTGLYTSL
jgi:hypothetical protein